MADYDLVIVGGGPGGYAAGLYAGNFDIKVAMIEADRVGGTCLHRGCIPAKQWLQVADVYQQVKSAADYGVQVEGDVTLDWKAALAKKQRTVDANWKGLQSTLKRRGTEIITGTGTLLGGGRVRIAGPDGDREVTAGSIIVATGSSPRTIPGYEIDGERVVTSDHALDWAERPQGVAIIGAGAIGCEFASFLADLGSTVSLIEYLPQILPGMEPDCAQVLARVFQKKGVSIATGVGAEPVEHTAAGVLVRYGEATVEADVVLVATGRGPRTEAVGLEATAAEVVKGFVQVDARQRTKEPNMYAVGDITPGPQLAHSAFAEAIVAVSDAVGVDVAPVNQQAIPLVVYTHPEVASVGLTEAAAREAGFSVRTGTFPFSHIARAMIQGETAGLVKVVAETDGRILGMHVAGPKAGELIQEGVLAVGWEAYPEEVAGFIHAHPTLSEALGEATMAVTGRKLHG